MGPSDAGISPAGAISQAPAMAATAASSSLLTGTQAQAATPAEPMVLAPSAMAASGPQSSDPRLQSAAPYGATATSDPLTPVRPGGPMPDRITNANATTPGTMGQQSLATKPVAVPSGGTPGGGLPDLGTTPLGAEPHDPPIQAMQTPAPIASPASVPTDPAVSPSAARTAQGPTAPGSRVASPKPMRGDPLLGPNPDLMPELPPLPDNKPAAAQPVPQTPASSPSASAPAAATAGPPLEPAAPPAVSPAGPPPDLGPPSVDPGPPTGDNRPAASTNVAQMPMPELAPASGQPTPTLAAQPAASAPSTAPATPPGKDAQVVRTAYQSPMSDARTPSTKHSSKSADQIAAKVGSEVITLQDLIVAIKEFCKEKNVNPNQLPPEEKNKIAGGVLRNLIERSLLAQEAKHTIKDPKQYDQFMQVADKVWREEQLPPLQYQYAVDNEQALRDKLREQGRSLEGMHQTFRQVFIAESFRHEKLKDKLKVELPDLLKYYNEHVSQHKFDRPAQITWREIIVEVAKYPNRDVARQKANALYEKLRRGADFAKLARDRERRTDQFSRSRRI